MELKVGNTSVSKHTSAKVVRPNRGPLCLNTEFVIRSYNAHVWTKPSQHSLKRNREKYKGVDRVHTPFPPLVSP